MKVLWLGNMLPGVVQKQINGKVASGLWMDHVLEGLRNEKIMLRILAPGKGDRGQLDERCGYRTFREGLPYVYLPELEDLFLRELEEFRPDVIHIWGTEYGHTLAMVNAAEKLDLLDRLVISIQGLCSVIAEHYAEGVPYWVQKRPNFRDFVRRDSIARQREKFAPRGAPEVEALNNAKHVIGRTHWDLACVQRINPNARYHLCNETLREAFYEGSWSYDRCAPHTVFASSHSYPVKGFHYALHAFAEVCEAYPDARLLVTGKSYFPSNFRQRLRQSGYQRHLEVLTKQLHLEDKIVFLGSLSPEEMKKAFLSANVFILPSCIENSPNALGEAMLLGVPCVASDVGGVMTMMKHGEEGYMYPSTAPYMLSHYIKELFVMGDRAAALGSKASDHARRTHDPEQNLRDLLSVYQEISG